MKNLLIIIAALVLVSCADSKKETEKKLRDEVIAIHDSIMPEMRTIRDLQKELEVKIQELDSSSVAQLEELESKSEKLESAGDEMMKWMRDYEDDFEDKTPEEIIEYLKKQKELITKVENEMTSAISEAKEYVEEK
ncbi:MAG: hypothetical protein AAF363_11775 [Bacteroidota bacterium]